MKNYNVTNQQMQDLCDQSEAYCPIDSKGNIQSQVTDDTNYIVDISADEQERHHQESEMMCIMDREGKNFYAVTVNPWW